MAYGNDLLSHVPADWIVDNASLTSSSITLEAHGTAKYKITELDTLPDSLLLVLIVETYGSADKAKLLLEYPDGTFVSYYVPVWETIVNTELSIPEGDFVSAELVVSSTNGLVISEYSLLTQATEDFTEVINGIKQEIPKLLWYYNTLEFQVSQEEMTIGMISMKLLKNVDLQGHMQVNCTASENSTVTLRIYDNDIQELYTPIEVFVERGRNSIGIPHSYIGRKLGLHTFIVTIQVHTGTLTVETRGFLYSIDGGYLAIRIMDVGYSVYDITLKQLPTEMDPSRIYAVCIDDGKALVRSRVYNEEYAIAWEPEYIIEDAVMACIEFHGLWILRDGEIGFTLETENAPHVMWIDSAGRLWDQKGPDVTTKFLMAEGVSYVSVCMSYNYAPDMQYDHGIVCAYIKAGQVFYKNLCRQSQTSTVWSVERPIEVLGAGNTKVTIVRLNDYRCAINAINSRSQWLISNRGYVGQSARPEKLFVYVKEAIIAPIVYTTIEERTVTSRALSLTLNSVPKQRAFDMTYYYMNEAPTIPGISAIDTVWLSYNCARITYDKAIYMYDDFANNFAARTAFHPCTIMSVTKSAYNALDITIQDELTPLDTLTIQHRGAASMHYQATDSYQPRVPVMLVDIPSPLLTTYESASVVINDISVSEISYTTLRDSFNVGKPASLLITVNGVVFNTITYEQVSDVPL